MPSTIFWVKSTKELLLRYTVFEDETTSAMPISSVPMPSVTTSDETLKRLMTIAFTPPTRTAKTSATPMPPGRLSPPATKVRRPPTATIEPTLRSNSPAIIVSDRPSATMPSSAKDCISA